MSTMQTQQTPKTWEDVLRMPDDGNRYEFIGGRLYVTAAPVTRHQRISKRLQAALMRILEDAGHGEVLSAPLLVQFPGTDDRVQPDLLFISEERREIIGERQVTGAPDLVVEILSPSTAHRDRGARRTTGAVRERRPRSAGSSGTGCAGGPGEPRSVAPPQSSGTRPCRPRAFP